MHVLLCSTHRSLVLLDVFDDFYDFCFCNEASLPTLHGQVPHCGLPTPLALRPLCRPGVIASGTGSASTDRVMRFVDDFATFEAAARYAVAQGIDWVNNTLSVRSAHPYSNAALPTRQPICI